MKGPVLRVGLERTYTRSREVAARRDRDMGSDSVVEGGAQLSVNNDATDLGPKQLTRAQCRAMVRIQLELEDLNTNVTDAWIDSLFDEFDEDGSNTIDDSEWDKLVAVLRARSEKAASGAAAARVKVEEAPAVAKAVEEAAAHQKAAAKQNAEEEPARAQAKSESGVAAAAKAEENTAVRQKLETETHDLEQEALAQAAHGPVHGAILSALSQSKQPVVHGTQTRETPDSGECPAAELTPEPELVPQRVTAGAAAHSVHVAAEALARAKRAAHAAAAGAIRAASGDSVLIHKHEHVTPRYMTHTIIRQAGCLTASTMQRPAVVAAQDVKGPDSGECPAAELAMLRQQLRLHRQQAPTRSSELRAVQEAAERLDDTKITEKDDDGTDDSGDSFVSVQDLKDERARDFEEPFLVRPEVTNRRVPPPVPERAEVSTPTSSPSMREASTVGNSAHTTEKEPSLVRPEERAFLSPMNRRVPPPVPDRDGLSTPPASPSRREAWSTGGRSFDTANGMDLSPVAGLRTPDRHLSPMPALSPALSEASSTGNLSFASVQEIVQDIAQSIADIDCNTDSDNHSTWWSHPHVMVDNLEIVGAEERTSASSWFGGTYIVCKPCHPLYCACDPNSHDIRCVLV